MVDSALLVAEDSILIVVDVQPPFLRKLAPEDQQPLLQRICWLIGVANWLQVPLIITAEDIPRLGTVETQITQSLPLQTPIYNKMIFDLMADPTIHAAVAQVGRKTAILVGLETDVCVAHSALGLLGTGYRVAVVADATGSPGTAYQFGLDRVQQAGGLVVSVKGLFYEWIRTVDQAQRFRSECKVLGVPKGTRL
jgi:nicotinamidase-related amidase